MRTLIGSVPTVENVRDKLMDNRRPWRQDSVLSNGKKFTKQMKTLTVLSALYLAAIHDHLDMPAQPIAVYQKPLWGTWLKSIRLPYEAVTPPIVPYHRNLRQTIIAIYVLERAGRRPDLVPSSSDILATTECPYLVALKAQQA